MVQRLVVWPTFRQSYAPQQVVGKIGGRVPNCASVTGKKRVERVKSASAVVKFICHNASLNPQLCGRDHAGIQ